MSALRIAHPGAPVVMLEERDPEAGLSLHQIRVLEILRAHNGNRSRAARQLGTTVQSVQATIRVMRRRDAPVPRGARRGPDLGPRVRSRRLTEADLFAAYSIGVRGDER